MQTQNELGFIKSLFDFKLTNFITMRVIRFLYTLLTIVTLIAGTFATIGGAISIRDDALSGILIVLLAPLGTLLYLILVRLWVEFLANLYRSGDNTQKMVNSLPSEYLFKLLMVNCEWEGQHETLPTHNSYI